MGATQRGTALTLSTAAQAQACGKARTLTIRKRAPLDGPSSHRVTRQVPQNLGLTFLSPAVPCDFIIGCASEEGREGLLPGLNVMAPASGGLREEIVRMELAAEVRNNPQFRHRELQSHDFGFL
ncbi:hypothetical protein H920_09996 [Fukomys damarensis]|uniref:Uncharacterized protein n=1 Tax=Fukomys damarensis TaxID=885580 RepID=A0A091DBZ5_FUKDA|nr:hypothetical protein H920_09996 [Fukomys damarensis]